MKTNSTTTKQKTTITFAMAPMPNGDEAKTTIKTINSIINRFSNTDMRQYYSGLLTFILSSSTPNMLNILKEFSGKLEHIYRSTNL